VRRLACLAFALLGSLSVAAPAVAQPTWVAGTIQETNILSCIQNIPENGTGAYLAYLDPDEGVAPQTGEVYYVAVVVAGLGNNCAGTIYNPQLILPPGTEPAISAANPIYCFASPSSGQPVQLRSGMCAGVEQLPDGNLQIDSSPAWAGTFEGNPIAPFFPIAQGYFEEEHVPVVSHRPLSGAQKLESDISTTDGGGQHLRPWVAPVVTAAAGEAEGPGGGEPPSSGGGSSGGGAPGGGAPGGGSGGAPGGGSGGGSAGGAAGSPPAAPSSPTTTAPAISATPTPSAPSRRRLRCRRGFKRRTVKGHPRCVRAKKHKHHPAAHR
jgi:hypothetical protein